MTKREEELEKALKEDDKFINDLLKQIEAMKPFLCACKNCKNRHI